MSSEPTARQIMLLNKEDHRFHAIGPVGTGLGMIATTEFDPRDTSKTVSFGQPSASALFINLAISSRLRRRDIDPIACFVDHPHPQGTFPEQHSKLFDYFEEFASEVIFSFLAIEAFVNENISSDFIYEIPKGTRKGQTLQGEELQRNISLDDKIKSVLPLVTGTKSPAGLGVWEQYLHLKRLRDRITHLKSQDRSASGPEDKTIWGSMLEDTTLFFECALSIMGSFPSLSLNRRWYQLALAKTELPPEIRTLT
jgi:hypothetical protein